MLLDLRLNFLSALFKNFKRLLSLPRKIAGGDCITFETCDDLVKANIKGTVNKILKHFLLPDPYRVRKPSS